MIDVLPDFTASPKIDQVGVEECASRFTKRSLKGDTKLVRSLLEANGFSFTESHEWNVLWASSSCK